MQAGLVAITLITLWAASTSNDENESGCIFFFALILLIVTSLSFI
jgi:hypothetical protein